uniref:Uncharacterized protein n=1 Tax=Rousettus aegyptiacus TaxID=9407 RepID=A0A7J8E8F9_ROUAE|nr:hypothetical protein HJG63_008122 [Rousettus aegyptiacus]
MPALPLRTGATVFPTAQPSTQQGERALRHVFSDSEQQPRHARGLCLLGPAEGFLLSGGSAVSPPLVSNEVHEAGRKADRIESKEDVQDPAESVVAVLHLGLPKARSARSAECPMCSCLKKQICSISSQ